MAIFNQKQFCMYALFIFCLLPGFTNAQTVSKYIVVDQFGYRPASEKIAVIRNPQIGFDGAESFAPGTNYALVNTENNSQVYSAEISAWNNGNIDESSGDQAWWFDFSSYEDAGTYYILDIDNNVRSFEFVIDEHVYEEVLKHAVRTFFYQRAGYAKEEPYADPRWADEASHLGPLQDSESRRFNAKNSSSTTRDLQGGWYDAGDYNKYTSWTANYIVDMLKAYLENPLAWGDNYCLPYSDNGIPDIIDEVKWGLDHLLRLQEEDGSLISIVSLDHASPPSSAKGQSLYGGINTSSTLAAAGAYALGSKIFSELGMTEFGEQLLSSAVAAWNWADENPNVIWENNSAAYNSVGIGAGQQETDDYGRFAYKMRAAVHLFEVTEATEYKAFIEDHYEEIHLMQWNYAYPFEQEKQETLLYYTAQPGASSTVVSAIKDAYKNAMESTHNFNALSNESDPYLAHLADYVWGSNGTKSRKGLMFTDYANYNINNAKNDDALRAAERYVHYIHGVNPLNFCYLSNMYNYGADNGVNEFYHTWFGDKTKWDRVTENTPGPAPAYLVGGANPSYDWDNCCPSGCSGSPCDISQKLRIAGQPKQKAYDDFNTSWPMNSWSVTENSCGYQVAYIRLLSKFVDASNSNTPNCTIEASVTGTEKDKIKDLGVLYPNPTSGAINIKSIKASMIRVFDSTGNHIDDIQILSQDSININNLPQGTYIIQFINDRKVVYEGKVIKKEK